MLQRYKEILFGLAFGIGAFLLDTNMDAAAGGNNFLEEVVAHPGMLLYRALFILLGLALGWLLWQRNRREREARQLAETLNRLRQKCAAQGLLLSNHAAKVVDARRSPPHSPGLTVAAGRLRHLAGVSKDR